MNFNATPLSREFRSARLGWLNYNFKNPADVRRARRTAGIQQPRQRRATGLGDTYTFTGSGNRARSRPSLLIDTYTGITTIQVFSEPDQPRRETRPSSSLAFRGRTGPDRLLRRMAAFQYHELLRDRLRGKRANSPDVDDNWQVDYTGERHLQRKAPHASVRRRHRAPGHGIARTDRRIGKASPSAVGRRRCLARTVGELSSTPSPRSYSRTSHERVDDAVFPFENFQHAKSQLAVQHFLADQWQPTRNLTASLGLRCDYFPIGTRTTRGMERYDLDTNPMLICGVGSECRQLWGRYRSRKLSPRVGLAYR